MDFIHKIAEEKINKAMEEGKFKDLSGNGRPVDLSAYFRLPEHLRLTYSILSNANILPKEVELLKEISSLKKELSGATSPSQKEKLQRKITIKTTELQIIMERYHRQKKG